MFLGAPDGSSQLAVWQRIWRADLSGSIVAVPLTHHPAAATGARRVAPTSPAATGCSYGFRKALIACVRLPRQTVTAVASSIPPTDRLTRTMANRVILYQNIGPNHGNVESTKCSQLPWPCIIWPHFVRNTMQLAVSTACQWGVDACRPYHTSPDRLLVTI